MTADRRRIRTPLPITTGFAAALAVAILLMAGVPAAEAAVPKCYGLDATIVGTDGPDSIAGTTGDDVIVALGGDDDIFFDINTGQPVPGNETGGNDVICAGDGNDFAVGGNGNDVVAGQDGDDVLYGLPGKDFVDGGRGSDQCTGGSDLEGPPDAGDRVYGCTSPTQFVVGQSAPDLVARTAFDNRFRLADLAGQTVMIDFSTVWCGPSTSMLAVSAGVQSNLRSRVPFTYVLGELESGAGVPMTRPGAEIISQKWGLSQLPVLHTEGTNTSQLNDAYHNYSSENVAYDADGGDSGINFFFPTLVFINPAGKVVDVHVGSLTGEEIQNKVAGIGSGLAAPTQVNPVDAPQTGLHIENLRNLVGALTITASAKATLQDQLTSALRAMEVRLKPKTSACDWMTTFERTLAKTTGIGSADRADILSQSANIKTKLGCKPGGKK
jgi:Ca2+-binding RTX toxin-like protein